MTSNSPSAPQSLEVTVARIEERLVSTNDKLDDLKVTLTTHTTANDARVTDLEHRVSTLENWRWKLVGIVTGVSLVIGGGAAEFVKAIHGG